MIPELPILVDGTAEFDERLGILMRRGAEDLDRVAPVVREILADVRRNGEDAVRRCVEAFERRSPAELVLRTFDGAGALARLPSDLRAALELAAARIAKYHERQRESGFRYTEGGIELGMRVRPLARVGVYAPGGKARYPSSVLMAAIPARVAGVREIVLATPGPDDAVLGAAHLAGVTTVLDAGGAHAIGALAYGLSNLPRVDKIVGPGNTYVSCAKRLVFGEVAIDGIAGPSEIVAVADETADAELVAADLLSQAEHDEAAYAVLVTSSHAVAEAVKTELARQLPALARRDVAAAAIAAHAALFVAGTRARMIEIANLIGGEHVALHVIDPEGALDTLPNVGAALLGGGTPVAVADYLAGPSHVLPTGGNVRFGSPLGVYDFVARTSIIRFAPEALARHAATIGVLARAEGLEAHARAVEMRAGRPPSATSQTVREPQSGP